MTKLYYRFSINHEEKTNLYNFLSANIKSINPMYPRITESFACTGNIFTSVFLFLINSLIYSGTCSTPKLSK